MERPQENPVLPQPLELDAAFWMGRRACGDCLLLDANPFEVLSAAWEQWAAGWHFEWAVGNDWSGWC
jgi:hypothetical protein